MTGGTAATCVSAGQSPCCNLPVFYMDYAGSVATSYPLMEFNVVPAAALAQTCVTGVTISFNVFNGTFGCTSNSLYHVLELLKASDWSSDSVSYTQASALTVYGTIVIGGSTSSNYQSGAGPLRYLTINAGSDLDLINANLQMNSGKVGLR